MRERIAASWALWSVLAAQATLTVPWMWRTGPFSGEALYLSAGQSGWSDLGSYTTSLPGSPVLYPPIAAWFDSIGGLIAARLLSLIFMLGATALVYLMADRMFGQISGLLAAVLFAVCGIIVHLGAAATFDPMALFFLVLSLYAAVRMRDGGISWVLLCPAALAVANATKYNTIAWDPLIIGTVLLYGWSKKTQAVCLTISVAATVAILDFGILMLGGTDFATGVLLNSFYHPQQTGPPSSMLSVLGHAMLMTGLIVLIAIAGVWVSVVKKMPASATAFLCLLVIAALVAPLLQARVHQMTSLDQNMSFGLPFAALGAGYALGGWRQWLGRRRYWGKVIATVAAVGTVITMLIVGRAERVQFRGPGVVAAQQVVTAIKQNYRSASYILVDGTDKTDRYYLPSIPEDKWLTSSSRFGPRPQMYGQICGGYVSVVVLRKTGQQYDNPTDEMIVPLVHQMYTRKTVAGKGDHKTMVWALKGSARSPQSCKVNVNVG
ncbi:MAG: ArnT family glycosyltransferase [Streptosporangiaceae bacterium]